MTLKNLINNSHKFSWREIEENRLIGNNIGNIKLKGRLYELNETLLKIKSDKKYPNEEVIVAELIWGLSPSEIKHIKYKCRNKPLEICGNFSYSPEIESNVIGTIKADFILY